MGGMTNMFLAVANVILSSQNRRQNDASRVRLLTATLLILSLLVLSGCSSLSAPAAWRNVQVGPGASEVESYSSFEEMAAAADAVGIADITGVRGLRQIGEERTGGVFMVQLGLRMQDRIKGPAEVTLELTLSTGQLQRAREAAEQIEGQLTRSEALVYLRRKADTPDFHRPVNSFGVWIDLGSDLGAPLAGEAPSDQLSTELRTVDSLEELLELSKS